MWIGSYEVLGEIGRGGAGKVLRARDASGRIVALKQLLVADPEQLARFEREGSILAALGEEGGFVPLLDRGRTAEGPFLVLPFLAGGTLRDRLERGRLEIDEATELVRALARAMGRAHERGIIHRDLKPENILFDDDGRPLIADTGLASRAGTPGSPHSLTQSGTIGGTLAYMPGEQLDGLKLAGPPADVFALGAILYECLAGEKAFAGSGAVSHMKQLQAGPKPLRELRPELPRWVELVVARALEKEPARRFPHGGALAAALEAGRKPEASRARSLAIGGGLALTAALSV